MKYFYSALLITVLSFTSCKNKETENAATSQKVIVPFTQQNNAPAPTPIPQKHNLFQENNSVSSPTVAQNLNPAHGQPNHRCDIAVGAPLSSPANAAAAVSGQQSRVTSTQVTTPVQNSTPKVVTPKGMNPPHGELGHRCDISVGAPLNSKPTSEQAKVEQNVPALLAPNTSEKPTPTE